MGFPGIGIWRQQVPKLGILLTHLLCNPKSCQILSSPEPEQALQQTLAVAQDALLLDPKTQQVRRCWQDLGLVRMLSRIWKAPTGKTEQRGRIPE